LPAVALPGGDLAATQPWRNLLAQMLAFVPDWQNFPETAVLQRQNWPVLARAIARNINAPLASSTGRLFDAVACALDCAPLQLSYEGRRPADWKRWRWAARMLRIRSRCRLMAISLI
jgi:hydrogenase maturation protein HypF